MSLVLGWLKFLFLDSEKSYEEMVYMCKIKLCLFVKSSLKFLFTMSSPSLPVVEHVRNEHDTCLDSIPTNYHYLSYFLHCFADVYFVTRKTVSIHSDSLFINTGEKWKRCYSSCSFVIISTSLGKPVCRVSFLVKESLNFFVCRLEL